MKTRAIAVALCSAIALSAWSPRGSPTAAALQDDEPTRALLTKLEQAVRAGDPNAYLALAADGADTGRARAFATAEFRRSATRVVFLERGREVMTSPQGSGLRLIVDVFAEFGRRGRVATWQLDLSRTTDNQWAVANQERLSAIDGIDRLLLNSTRQFAARNFTARAEDLDLTLDQGSVFTVDTDQGITALVLLGQGTMHFHPAPQVEKRQIRIFAGSDTLESRFEAAYIRLGQLGSHADMSQLVEQPVDPRELHRAELVFEEESSKSFAIDLSEFSGATWTLVPDASDFLAEVRTRRFGTLTYSQLGSAQEDISLFDRRRQKNIAVYTSAARLAAHGRVYRVDPAAYDVHDYDIDLAFDPARRWVEGRARLRLTTGSTPTNQITLHLASSLVVRSVTSGQFGRLFSVRMGNQDTLLVTLPALLLPETDVTLTVTYGGRLGSQPVDREMLSAGQIDLPQDLPFSAPQLARREERYLYSNQSYWYPRPSVGDYATATLRITVPAAFECIASGELSADSPELVDEDSRNPAQRRKRFVFTAERPLRYLSFFVSRLSHVDRTLVALNDDDNDGIIRARGPAMEGAAYNTLNVTVLADAGLALTARDLAPRTADMARFYRSMMGDSPYSSLALALIEGARPGGHSPGHFVILTQPPPDEPRVWRNDPAAFDQYADFFPAHEVAHQWWGQAVGWNTYHDQWLSEGFAQYFAALYTGQRRGNDVFRAILGDMRKWAMSQSDQGPVYLGYRLGHVQDDTRVFRALVYDKGATVLHMLRRLVGDDAFFLGIRRFYAGRRYQNASTDDFRRAMEGTSGRALDTFFERWIYGSTLPQLTFSYRVQDDVSAGRGREILLRVDQAGELFDVPVTVVLQYANRPPAEVIMAVSARATEVRIPLAGTLRRVDISKDDGTLADVRKN